VTLLLPAVAALALAAEPCTMPALRPGPLPWRTGEVIHYDVDVMGMVKAGTMSMEVGRPMFEGKQVPLRARVKNTSIFAKIRRITGTAFSWVDSTTLLPERYRDEVVEDGVKKTTDARMRVDPAAVTIETQFGDQKASTRYERKAEVLDALAAAYYLRAADLQPGAEICFDLVANRRFWRYRARVAEKPERVETAGGLFDTLRIDGTVTRADLPGVSRPMHVWISTDPRRVLVGAVSEIDLGPVSALVSRPP
jgi:hypothetical protein